LPVNVLPGNKTQDLDLFWACCTSRAPGTQVSLSFKKKVRSYFSLRFTFDFKQIHLQIFIDKL